MSMREVVGRPRQCLLHTTTTRCDPTAAVAADLVQRACSALRPDQRGVAGSASLPTEQDGLLSHAVMLDAFGRWVVGWSMQARLRTDLVLGALEQLYTAGGEQTS